MIKLYFIKFTNYKSQSELFVRKILGDYLSIDRNSLVISRNKYGKPYLKGFPNIHYNLSHTKNVLVFAMSDKPIGVDVEKIRKLKKRISERFFTKDEQNYIYQNTDNQDEKFIKVWTMKESYVKWIGKGMKIPFESFNVLKKNEIVTLIHGAYCIAICSEYCSENVSLVTDNIADQSYLIQ